MLSFFAINQKNAVLLYIVEKKACQIKERRIQ